MTIPEQIAAQVAAFQRTAALASTIADRLSDRCMIAITQHSVTIHNANTEDMQTFMTLAPGTWTQQPDGIYGHRYHATVADTSFTCFHCPELDALTQLAALQH